MAMTGTLLVMLASLQWLLQSIEAQEWLSMRGPWMPSELSVPSDLPLTRKGNET